VQSLPPPPVGGAQLPSIVKPSMRTLPNWSPVCNGCEHDVWNLTVCSTAPPGEDDVHVTAVTR
jgi:hypothetical protein